METRKNVIINNIILIVLALTIRVAIVAFHEFDGLYGQDAFAYYGFGQDLLAFVTHQLPPPPFAWTLGYPLVLAVGFGVFGISEAIALAISIGMGALLPVLVYLIGLHLKIRSPYSFFAGLLMAFSGQALQSSLVIMSDIPALFFALTSLLCLLHYSQSHRRLWLLICAFFISFALMCRPVYLVLPPLYLLIILMTMRSKYQLLDLVFAVPFVLLPYIPQFIYNFFNPTNLLDHAWVEGWSLSNLFSQNFVNIDGTFHYESINAVFYAYPLYDVRYLSPLLALFIIIGAIILVRKRIWQNVILVSGWIGLPYIFLAGIPYQNIRFAMIILPVVIILVALGLQAVARIQHRVRWIFLLLSLSGLIHTAVIGFDYANAFVNQHQSEKAIVEWISDQVPDGATIYTFGSTLTLQHYSDLNVIELYYETPATLNQRWYKGRADYVVLNIWQIENQWQGREPQANYHWLRDERGLTQLGKLGHVTLFEAHE